MFDISWSEFLLIGVVALIVIGPKELPGVLRTLGQYTRKVRGMASEFQSQFQEAMREAEMADLKKQVDDMAQDLKDFDPLKEVKSDVEAMSKDIERSLEAPAEATPAPAADTAAPAVEAAAPALETPAVEAAAPTTAVQRSDLEAASATAEPSAPAADEVAPEKAERPA
jgi:sec-independent protein translocase protein TatB